MMRITYIRKRIDGPERTIEDAVVARLRELFFSEDEVFWTLGSMWLGPAQPDLLAAAFRAEVRSLATLSRSSAGVLASLRVEGMATRSQLVDHMRLDPQTVDLTVEVLRPAGLIKDSGAILELTRIGRDPLPEVIAIEAKVSNLERARQQCFVASTYAHRTYLAGPRSLARRAAADRALVGRGVGALAVDPDGHVEIVRPALRRPIVMWLYYYEIAIALAHLIDRYPTDPAEARRLLDQVQPFKV